ncbi:MAG: hypothetical protein MJA30_14840 [Cytophagales bacterium]|nr:hypothetical protein [Cytophagales bacterium]
MKLKEKMKMLSLQVYKKDRMDLQTAKLNVLQKIMGVTTSSLLDKISDLLDKEMIVGYTAEGEPLTKASYNERLEQAEAQLRSGDYITQEDLESESDNW